MSEEQKPKGTEEPLGLVAPEGAFPAGGEDVEAGYYPFFNFDHRGQMVTGLLLDTQVIPDREDKPVDRWKLLLDTAEIVILPSHVDLDRALREVHVKVGMRARVVIAYLGKEPVEGVPQPMARYKVKQYGVEGVKK